MNESGSKKFVGKNIPRREDNRVLRGETRYVDDFQPKDVAYVGFCRSTVAHARIDKIDLRSVENDPRVLALFTGSQIKNYVNSMPVLEQPEGALYPEIFPLAVDKVRHVGEPVVAVVVRNRYDIEDIIDEIGIDYIPLPVVCDVERSAKEDAPLLFESWERNIAYETRLESGDIDQAFEGASCIVSGKFVTNRQYGSSMETRGVIANCDQSDGFLSVWTSTQWPHVVRTLIASTLRYPENRIRVIAPDVGGGFGNKQEFYREDVVLSYIAMKLKRPVKWVATRSEDIISTVQARDTVHEAQLALDKEGRILGLKDSILADLGAHSPLGLGPPRTCLTTISGPYEIPSVEINLKCVVTNKVPVGAYRGFGQPEASFVIERLIDMAAKKIGVEAYEIRRRNVAKKFPYLTSTGVLLDSGDFEGMIDLAIETIDLYSFRKMQKKLRAESRYIGLGLALGIEAGGIGPNKAFSGSRSRYLGFETITLRIDAGGKVTIFTGLSPHGQGLSTVLSQVCAESLGLNIDDIVVVHGDTLSCPYGFGTWGSRSAVVGASTLLRCIEKIKQKMKKIAAYQLEAREEDLIFNNGKIFVRGSPHAARTIQEIAASVYMGENLPENIEPGLECTETYEPPELVVAGGVHVAIVQIDPEDGKLKLLRYIMIHDCGNPVNPAIVDGQLQGGIAQGVAGALFEEILYNDDGQQLTASFMDYLIPTAMELPEYELFHLNYPSPFNELGMKGVGESGIIGSAPAIANAVVDALSQFDIDVAKTPVTPEVIFAKLQSRM